MAPSASPPARLRAAVGRGHHHRRATRHGFPIPDGIAVVTSFLQHVPFLWHDPRRALPLLPLAWRLLPAAHGDVVICSSSAWAHRVRVKPGALKIVYCHNPARRLYQTEDYLVGRSPLVRVAARLLHDGYMRGDSRRAAASADLYLANSSAVASRIREAYGIEATVVHPPMTLDVRGEVQPVGVSAPSYFLTVARGRGYKNTESLVEAFRRMPDEHLIVIGDLPPALRLPSNVERIPHVTEGELPLASTARRGACSPSPRRISDSHRSRRTRSARRPWCCGPGLPRLP